MLFNFSEGYKKNSTVKHWLGESVARYLDGKAHTGFNAGAKLINSKKNAGRQRHTAYPQHQQHTQRLVSFIHGVRFGRARPSAGVAQHSKVAIPF